MRVKCLAQEHNTMTQPGLKPKPLDLESSTLTNRSPGLPTTSIRDREKLRVLVRIARSKIQMGTGNKFLNFNLIKK